MENLLTIEQLSRWLNISERQIYRLRHQGLPFLKLGHKATRYDVRQVEIWLQFQNPKLRQETIGELGIRP